MSFLNSSEDFHSTSPRPRDRRSVEIGKRISMGSPNAEQNNRRNQRRSGNKRKPKQNLVISPRQRSHQRSTDHLHNQTAGMISPRRSNPASDIGLMPIMFEVDDEESSRSGLMSSSFHSAFSNVSRKDRSPHSRNSRSGSDELSSFGADVIGGSFSEDNIRLDTTQDISAELSIPHSAEFQMPQIPRSGEFQLDLVPETPEHKIRAVLQYGIDHSSEGGTPRSNILPSLSLDDDSDHKGRGEQGEENINDDASEEVEASEESEFEEKSDDEDEDNNDEDENGEDSDSDSSDDDEKDEDDDDDDEEESDDEDEDDSESESSEDDNEEEESEEPSEESELAGGEGDTVLPATIGTNNESSSSEFRKPASNEPQQITPPPRPRRRMQLHDSGMPSEPALQYGYETTTMSANENSSSEFRETAAAAPRQTTPPPRSRRRMQLHDSGMPSEPALQYGYETTTMSTNENSSEFRETAAAAPSQITPPPRPRRRMQLQDSGMPSEPTNALQLDSAPTRARQPRSPRPPQSGFSNSLQLNAPPSQSRQDRMGAPQDTFSTSLQLDAPLSQERQRSRSHERLRPPQDNVANSLELDAPPTRQRQRVKSHEPGDGIDSFNNALSLDAPASQQRQRVRSNESYGDGYSLDLDAPQTTRPRQRMHSHESHDEMDEGEAGDTIADLPMAAPRTRTRTRQHQTNQPNRMMSFEPFAIGNSKDTLQVDMAPPRQEQGRRRTKPRDRIMSVGPGMHDLPQLAPKINKPPERRLSLDSRKHVYENDNIPNPFAQRFEAQFSPSGTKSKDSRKTESPPPKNKSLDDVEGSPGAKNRRRLRSADDLAEIRTKSMEVEQATKAKRSVFKRRSSSDDDSPRREKAAYLLGMHKGSVAQGRELKGVGPMGTRQPRQRPAPNRFKPLPPPPSNDELDIDDMVAIKRFSELQAAKRPSAESDDSLGDGSNDTMEMGGVHANPFAIPNRRKKQREEERSPEIDQQKDSSKIDEKQFWLFVTFLTALGTIFGFVAVKVS